MLGQDGAAMLCEPRSADKLVSGFREAVLVNLFTVSCPL